MAKMFYSLEEAAQKIGKGEEEVRQMASRGEITEFRDGDRLIFKVDQIDLLCGQDDDAGDMSSMISLADTGGQSAVSPAPVESAPESDEGSTGIDQGAFEMDSGAGASGSSQGLSDFDNAFSLEDSGAGSGGSGLGSGGDAQEASGIPVFDTDELEEADPAAQTQMTDQGIDGGLNLDQLGSGSGLMDLTRESDDTSLGAEGLLDELYQGDDAAPEETVASGDLFEGAPSTGDLDSPEGAGVAVAAAEPYDPRWSGLTGGLAVGMIAGAAVGAGMLVMSIAGAAPSFVYDLQFGPLSPGMVWVLIPAVVGVVMGVIGMALSKNQ